MCIELRSRYVSSDLTPDRLGKNPRHFPINVSQKEWRNVCGVNVFLMFAFTPFCLIIFHIRCDKGLPCIFKNKTSVTVFFKSCGLIVSI